MPDSMIWDIITKYSIGKYEDENCMLAVNEIVKIIRNLRNELCLKCGKYVNAHKGSCDMCKWR